MNANTRELSERLRNFAGLDLANGKTCVKCKAPYEMGVNVFTAEGVKEIHISGVCEKCFDEMFSE